MAFSENPRLNDEEYQDYERTTICIPSLTQSWSLDAWKYIPAKTPGPYPVIVMAHSLSAKGSMGLETYAQAFVSLGYACVAFDYRHWGSSDGKPRHSIFVSEQLEDYRTVIEFCRQQSRFDSQRVILWGSSLSGGHVVLLASERELNICAAIAQCPYLGIAVRPSLNVAGLKTVGYALLDVLKQAVGLAPVLIPAVAPYGEVAALPTSGPVQSMYKLVYDEGPYPKEITASSLFEILFYRPNLSAKNVTCPVLIVALKQDELFDIRGAVEVARDAPNAQLVEFDGGHFDVYPGGRLYDQSLTAQMTFLLKQVPI
ncbi:unnamed protein product [Somion occarium]|uniref:Serine aminopeptidase S33 domain-containing protein n=1 Tax=Somion occarium TaxID=3059160 RepID=A0ABP1E870_9APHY